MKTKGLLLSVLLLSGAQPAFPQLFTRTELPAALTTPWEIIYGPDNYLWVSEASGIISRIDPVTGSKAVVYTAPDYFGGSPLEQLALCTQNNIGAGTHGLALHPDFPTPGSSYIYFVYSYNSGTVNAPATLFKIVRLSWDPLTESVTGATDLVTLLPNGYDHYGGRLMAIRRAGIDYLFYTAGDNGISEDSNPGCYVPQSTNPNNFTQDPNYKNGKVHRFNIDGSIPFDNPVPGNSMYTRGHRNPQGLAYNAGQDILYEIEHGDRTDDEINILESGRNYGWKNVRGYHADNNFPGEAAFVSSYVPNPGITGDALTEPVFSWCDTPVPSSTNYFDWCTVAPSDAIYYNSPGIPEWTNSILVVTLKDGVDTDQELYQFKLQPNGSSLVPGTTQNPNPRKYFGTDQAMNGRLRDIAISPDGLKIYLVNNWGANSDKITVYTYAGPSGVAEISSAQIKLSPNPVHDVLKIDINAADAREVIIYNLEGRVVGRNNNQNTFDVSGFESGMYFMEIVAGTGVLHARFVKE